MSRSLLTASLLLASSLGACERGHYATRDHVASERSTGGETTEAGPEPSPERSGEERSAGGETSSSSAPERSATATEVSAGHATGSAAEASTTSDPGSEPHSDAGGGDTRGHAPEEEMARAQVLRSRAVTIRVHTTSGPVTRLVAERALEMQRMRIDHCFRTTAGPDAAGSMRASIHVEPSGAARVELETMTPELDRVLPCVDAALERTPFPAASDGRPTHVVAEIARTP